MVGPLMSETIFDFGHLYHFDDYFSDTDDENSDDSIPDFYMPFIHNMLVQYVNTMAPFDITLLSYMTTNQYRRSCNYEFYN